MSLPVEACEVPGAKDVYNWFGFWPSFHDAEIISLHLNRVGTSFLRVHTWEMTTEVDERGYYRRTKNVVVEFVMESVCGLTLSGFNHQNVIFGLRIEKTDSGFRVSLDDCYGLAGTMEAEKLSLRITAGKPSTVIPPQ